MLTLLSMEHAPKGSVRRYLHPNLGELRIVTFNGADGAADVIMLHSAIALAQCRRAMMAESRESKAAVKGWE